MNAPISACQGNASIEAKLDCACTARNLLLAISARHIVRRLATAALLIPLSGCAFYLADHIKAGDRMEQSGKDYRACLGQHLDKPALCEPLEKVWKADKEAYRKESL